MARTEFSQTIKKTVIKRATKASVVYCEKCGLPAKKWQIDHVVADAHGGKATLENAELICDVCYGVKNPADTKIAAKIKRQEAKHIGAKPAPTKPIQSAPFAAPAPKDRTPSDKTRVGDGSGRYLFGRWVAY